MRIHGGNITRGKHDSISIVRCPSCPIDRPLGTDEASGIRDRSRDPVWIRPRAMALVHSGHAQWRRDHACVFHRVGPVRRQSVRAVPEPRPGWFHVEPPVQHRGRGRGPLQRPVWQLHPAPATKGHVVGRHGHWRRTLPLHAAMGPGEPPSPSGPSVLAAVREPHRERPLLSRGIPAAGRRAGRSPSRSTETDSSGTGT